MASDFWIVLQWWGALFLVGAAAWPLTKWLFGGIGPVSSRLGEVKEIGENTEDGLVGRSYYQGWWDEGYFFSKAVGMAVVTWVVYVLGMVRFVPFSTISISVSLVFLFIVGIIFNFKFSIFNENFKFQIKNSRKNSISKTSVLMLEEVCFFTALLFWSWVKAHEPSIRALEKFMDYGFMQSILNSQFFPPQDMWYAGSPINYYYFGHLVTAVLTRLSGLDLGYTFNLMLATLFALTITMSFSIGVQVFRVSTRSRMENHESGIRNYGQRKRITIIYDSVCMILAGLVTAFLVTFAGNMQTIYAFTRGYTGDPPEGGVRPFWELLWGIGEIGGIGGLWDKIGEGMSTYWYANATRFIPYTIHEFPSYSFVVSDVHGHVLSLPFVLLAIALLVAFFGPLRRGESNQESGIGNQEWIRLGFYGFLLGILLMTNASDGPVYLGLFILLSLIHDSIFMIRGLSQWKQSAIVITRVLVVVALTSLPFLTHFTSFVSGLAVNCPPAFLANMKFGPIVFEGVEKCQRSPLWMWWLLWGFFLYCAVGLLYNLYYRYKGYNYYNRTEKLLAIFFLFALGLVVFPEFFYFKDIYPAHFRSNTMFKLGYQAYILFSIVSGYFLSSYFFRARTFRIRNRESGIMSVGRMLFFLLLIPQIILVSVYPIFSVRSYFGGLTRYEGLYGLHWIAREYPDDWEAIRYLNQESARFAGEAGNQGGMPKIPWAIVEADGESYTDYGRISAFTGLPSVIGWPVHEWLWRGTYDLVAPRREDVRRIYESDDAGETARILNTYSVRYVIVGKLERDTYKNMQEWKFPELGREAYRSGATIVYAVGAGY